MKKYINSLLKQSPNYLTSLIKYSLILASIIFVGKNLKFIFEAKTQYLVFDQLPIEIKNDISEFEQAAKIYNVDVLKLKDIHYVLIYSSNLNFGGYSGLNSIFINMNSDRLSLKKIIWHELGHQVLNYGHDLRDSTSHLMNSGRSTFIDCSWEEQKRLFFQEPMPRNHIKNSIKSIYSNNYFILDLKESYYDPFALYFHSKILKN